MDSRLASGDSWRRGDSSIRELVGRSGKAGGWGTDQGAVLTSNGGDFTACWLSERLRVPPTRRRSIWGWRREALLRAGSLPWES